MIKWLSVDFLIDLNKKNKQFTYIARKKSEKSNSSQKNVQEYMRNSAQPWNRVQAP